MRSKNDYNFGKLNGSHSTGTSVTKKENKVLDGSTVLFIGTGLYITLFIGCGKIPDKLQPGRSKR